MFKVIENINRNQRALEKSIEESTFRLLAAGKREVEKRESLLKGDDLRPKNDLSHFMAQQGVGFILN